jgi:hypothetical protein
MSEPSHAAAGGPGFLWVALIPLSAFLALAWGFVLQPLPWHAS